MNLIQKTKEALIFENLLKSTTLEEIITILDKDDYDKYYVLGGGIHDFILEYYKGDKKIKKKLQNKIKMYKFIYGI